MKTSSKIMAIILKNSMFISLKTFMHESNEYFKAARGRLLRPYGGENTGKPDINCLICPYDGTTECFKHCLKNEKGKN